MKKLTLLLILTVLLLAMVGGVIYYETTQLVTINGEKYRHDVTVLDLSGTAQPEIEQIVKLEQLRSLDLRGTGLTVDQYEQLRAALPECAIAWEVPFQGRFYAEDTASITIASLTMAEVEALDYLPGLQSVDATACRDYEALRALIQRRPECKITCTVTIGGSDYREDTTQLTLESADVAQVEAALPWLPALESVTFIGTAPESSAIAALKEQYPAIRFCWDFEVLGVTANSMDTALDLSGATLEDIAALETALRCFYQLERVDIYDRTVTSEEIDALARKYPQIRFVWTVQMGRCELRTDATTFMPYHFGYTYLAPITDAELQDLKYCTDIICMDLGHMAITDYSFLENMPHLQYLVLADTDGSDFSALAGLKELKFLEVFLTDFSDTEVLLNLTALEDLNVSWSAVENIEPLLQMDYLHRLWIPGNHLTAEEQAALTEALPNTKILFHSRESTDQGWRESPNYYAMRDLLGMWYMTG